MILITAKHTKRAQFFNKFYATTFAVLWNLQIGTWFEKLQYWKLETSDITGISSASGELVWIQPDILSVDLTVFILVTNTWKYIYLKGVQRIIVGWIDKLESLKQKHLKGKQRNCRFFSANNLCIKEKKKKILY